MSETQKNRKVPGKDGFITSEAPPQRNTSHATLRLFAFVVALALAAIFQFDLGSVRNVAQLMRAPIEHLISSSGQVTHVRRVVAVGDLHGDFDHLLQILRRADIIDEKNKWCGGETVFVQTGDIVDRGTDTIQLYTLFDELRPQAQRAGGQLVSLLGNHEIMNSLLDWRYVTQDDIDTFGGVSERQEAVTEGWIGQTWRANYSATARVSFFDSVTDAAASFVHGGIVPEYLKHLDPGNPIDIINSLASSILAFHTDSKTAPGFPASATFQQRIFWSALGPLWNRMYAEEEEDVACPLVKEAAELLHVRHLVIAHTPFLDGILSRCGGSLFLIDTGISKAYGGRLSSLEIVYEVLDDVVERERVSALYVDQKAPEVLHVVERRIEKLEEKKQDTRTWMEKLFIKSTNISFIWPFMQA